MNASDSRFGMVFTEREVTIAAAASVLVAVSVAGSAAFRVASETDLTYLAGRVVVFHLVAGAAANPSQVDWHQEGRKEGERERRMPASWAGSWMRLTSWLAKRPHPVGSLFHRLHCVTTINFVYLAKLSCQTKLN